MKLGMTIVCRDEADIIEDNLRFHHRSGVDQFVVVDNGSVDGTCEILDRLRWSLPVEILHEAAHTRVLDTWVMRAVDRLRSHGCTWVIPNDADEFWWTRDMDLKVALTDQYDVVSCGRANFLPTAAQVRRADYRFYHNRLRVAAAWGTDTRHPDSRVPIGRPTLWSPVGNKVACRLDGLSSLAFGNHAAEHSRGREIVSRDISILHFPVRTYGQFERKVQKHGEDFAQTDYGDSMKSWHLRRLWSFYERGLLREEYDANCPGEEAVTRACADGLLVDDDRARELADVFAAEPLGAAPSAATPSTAIWK